MSSPAAPAPLQPSLPSVFDYLDFRRYLDDYFTTRKLLDKRFSLRTFAANAGLPLSNSSLFSKVIAGKRNLTSDLQLQIGKALKLSGSELQYFVLLVRFNQSKASEARELLYQEITRYRKSKARVMTQEAEDFYAHWRHAVVRAFFGINQKEKNAAKIGRQLFPTQDPQEVEDSIQLMLGLGLITKTANGYALNGNNLATVRENPELVGKQRIFEMLDLARNVLGKVPAKDRDYSAMTVFISRQGYQAIMEKIRLFREEVKAIVSTDREEDRVYTLGLQFFPNSQLPDWKPQAGRKEKDGES